MSSYGDCGFIVIIYGVVILLDVWIWEGCFGNIDYLNNDDVNNIFVIF